MTHPATRSKERQELLGSAWMIAAALFFTLMNLCIKAAHQQFAMGSGELVFWRMVFAAAVLGATAKMQGKTFATPHWKSHLNRSVSGTVGMTCGFYAVMRLPLATGVTLAYTSSIFLAVLSVVVLRERISAYTFAVLLTGFAGVVLLLKPSFAAGQEWAAAVGLFGGLAAGWAYMQVRELSLLGEPAWRVVFYLSLVGMAMGAALATLTGWHSISLQSAPYLIGIGASAVLAQLALTHAYAVGRKFTVAALAYLTVVFSTLAGIFLFGEQIGWQEWLGIGIIAASGILSGLKK
ncbi:putative membrane protein [Neisseria sp. oral taxon 020 str. F0370]|uniref:DMT family transporter n=1 Tax=unclassified Neisseria TaxID=2623750 RepID=UPI0002A22817|nr:MULTISPECIES: DMT family transporter [unclassified Neisseria]ASP17689.1 EamA/RhaT family transporter [Neisseria sp. KEM232]EKY08694.1 putative membrane protein [Neisseria sp. oral taxon 020 str. F0370]